MPTTFSNSSGIEVPHASQEAGRNCCYIVGEIMVDSATSDPSLDATEHVEFQNGQHQWYQC